MGQLVWAVRVGLSAGGPDSVLNAESGSCLEFVSLVNASQVPSHSPHCLTEYVSAVAPQLGQLTLERRAGASSLDTVLSPHAGQLGSVGGGYLTSTPVVQFGHSKCRE